MESPATGDARRDRLTVGAPGWPATLRCGQVAVCPLRLRDGGAWVEIRLRNEEWLAPWESSPAEVAGASLPWAERQSISAYAAMLRALRRQARAATALPFALRLTGRLAGQINVTTVVRGSLCSGTIGYWLDQRVAGRGVMPVALALVVDHCFTRAGLHRIAADIRPENLASRRVVEKLGFRQEALYRNYLAINGDWHDHVGYALTTEDVPDGVLARYLATHPSPVSDPSPGSG